MVTNDSELSQKIKIETDQRYSSKLSSSFNLLNHDYHIFDDKLAVINLDNLTAYTTNNKFILEAFKSIHQTLWSVAT